MVVLQLRAKIYPRKQAHDPGQDSDENEYRNGPRHYATLLLSIPQPEECSVARLGWLISEEWASLFPNQEKLVIKKIVMDEDHTLLLRPQMSVAQIWVNQGKAHTDGWDQCGVVGVIQKPSSHVPQRLPSAVPEFDKAMQTAGKRVVLRVSPVPGESDPEPEPLEQAGPTDFDEPEMSCDVPIGSVEVETPRALPYTPSSPNLKGNGLLCSQNTYGQFASSHATTLTPCAHHQLRKPMGAKNLYEGEPTSSPSSRQQNPGLGHGYV